MVFISCTCQFKCVNIPSRFLPSNYGVWIRLDQIVECLILRMHQWNMFGGLRLWRVSGWPTFWVIWNDGDTGEDEVNVYNLMCRGLKVVGGQQNTKEADGDGRRRTVHHWAEASQRCLHWQPPFFFLSKWDISLAFIHHPIPKVLWSNFEIFRLDPASVY
jgi:hypothetical protein